MKTKSYTKYLGILLVIVSVFTLFFNWISAARYIKNLQKAASDSLGFFSDHSYTDALIEDASIVWMTRWMTLGIPPKIWNTIMTFRPTKRALLRKRLPAF